MAPEKRAAAQAADEHTDAAAKRVKVESGSADAGADAQATAAVKTEQQDGSSVPDAAVDMKHGGVKTEDGLDDEDDVIRLPQSSSRSSVRKGHECPYLDTILRQNLDFDFEKCCSVTLSPINVYVCLVCGKYFQVKGIHGAWSHGFARPAPLLQLVDVSNHSTDNMVWCCCCTSAVCLQGRGLNTQAYTHSLETSHHMFMKLDNGKVYCLPDNYEVVDRSLDDIRAVLNPAYTQEEVAKLDTDVTWVRALDGSEYMPGLVGLNNMKANDYINVVIQVLARVNPIRNFFLIPSNYAGRRSLLVNRFGELIRKLWNKRNFKGQVSPHEFIQAVMAASKRRFTIEQQGDPVDFWSWLLNSLHMDLTGGKPKKSSIVSRTFQGELEVTTLAGTGKGKAATATEDVVEPVPFLLLGLELPPTPLFKDALEKNIIPQVPIYNLLAKFNSTTISDDIRQGRRKFRVTRLPNFLALHFKRFTKNNFYIEKNPTLVTFPVKSLDLRDALPVPNGSNGQPLPSKYDLIANVMHEGKAGQQTGTAPYRAHIHRSVEKAWYEVQDLVVLDVLPQMVALSEAYFQVYQCQQSQQPQTATKGKEQGPPQQQQQPPQPS
eukprot:GHRR01015458.1.p1 GENE.GHRR01015458.1~~GHRR01015458.1.p1  ORF type:complete len:604 (+),score=171.22 GHRR01015458.1:206-2017(+)